MQCVQSSEGNEERSQSVPIELGSCSCANNIFSTMCMDSLAGSLVKRLAGLVAVEPTKRQRCSCRDSGR